MAFFRNPLNAVSLQTKLTLAFCASAAKLAALYAALNAILNSQLEAAEQGAALLALFGFAAVLAGLILLLIGRSIIQPLAKAEEYLRRLENGDTNFEVRAIGKGPVHDLFRTIKALRGTVERANADLQLIEQAPVSEATGYLKRLEQGETDFEMSTPDEGPLQALFEGVEALKETVERAYAGLQMIDNVPTAVMVADPKDDFKITYMNASSDDVLSKIKHLLPEKSADILGKSVDIFHKNPEHQRQLLSDPKNLPWSTVIALGDEKIRLKINAINNTRGEYIGPMLCWDVITQQHRMEEDFDRNINAIVGQLSTAIDAMQHQMEALGEDAQAAVSTSENVSSAAETTASNVETVAAAAEELSSSIREISEQLSRSTQMATDASSMSVDASTQAEGLSEAAEKISEVVTMISTIAGQTNLLALNATIEAARAGAAGKGFAVVASEVKTLANQTARATKDIETQIESVQGIASNTVEAVRRVTDQMDQMGQIFASVAAAVEEQSAATSEISGNAQKAASGTQSVTSQMTKVHESGIRSSKTAEKTLEAAQELAIVNEQLGNAAAGFLKSVQDAAA